ncbi:MAG: glutathione S-transferase family protein [Alcaligenaceae bacterium]|nr:glutathione S-transferase family protein [Alcaligenaceae bacterium]
MNATITLYHSVSARSFRALWTLEELNVNYHLIMLDFPPRAHHKEFFEINPLGTVPALMTDGGLMTESAAICQYLASKKPDSALTISEKEADYPQYLNFLHYGEATLTFPQTLVLRYRYFETPERQLPSVAEDYSQWFISRSKLLDRALQDKDSMYLCGDRFTIADISVAYALMLAEYVGLLDQCSERVQAYWQRLKQRPAYMKALKKEQEAAAAQGVSTQPAPGFRPFQAKNND